MVEVTSQQGAVLAFVSLATLGLISAICLGCRKKSRIVQEDNQIYVPQVFQREGSRFAVTQSKTVTRPNQRTPELTPRLGQNSHAVHVQPHGSPDTQSSYQNLPKVVCGSLEPTYVHPIPTPPYTSLSEIMDNDLDAGAYENVFPTKDIDHDSGEDYENAPYLNNTDEDEPDYVNAQPD